MWREATIILKQIFPVSTKGNIIMGKLKDVFKVDKPIIGMVHLRPLPGSPKYDPVNMGMDKIISIALEEAAMLEQAIEETMRKHQL